MRLLALQHSIDNLIGCTFTADTDDEVCAAANCLLGEMVRMPSLFGQPGNDVEATFPKEIEYVWPLSASAAMCSMRIDDCVNLGWQRHCFIVYAVAGMSTFTYR